MARIDPLPTNLSPESLLQSLGVAEARDIDIKAIAYYVGLRVQRRCLKCCEAMITGKGNKGIIYVAPGGMPQRERFSIAHELGHWAIHGGETVALIRMIDSDVYPTAIMISHGTGGKKWHRAECGIPGYWLPKADFHSESFAFDLLHNANAADKGFPRKIDADARFDNWAAPKYQITEQSFRITGEGMITILNLDPGMIR